MTPSLDDLDMPEGSIWRPVKMSDTLFRILGASGVDWGEPDADGFYIPTVKMGPDGRLKYRTAWPDGPGEDR